MSTPLGDYAVLGLSFFGVCFYSDNYDNLYLA